MKPRDLIASVAGGGAALPWPRENRLAWWRFAATVAGLALAFALPLFETIRTAWHSDLFSYLLLIPLISGFIAWQRSDELAATPVGRDVTGMALLVGAALLLLVVRFTGVVAVASWDPVDRLAFGMLTFVLLVYAGAAWWLGRATLRAIAGPAALLLFLIPPPTALVTSVEIALQHGSAAVVGPLFALWGTPVVVDGLVVTLPGQFGPFQLQVARECSGIHATIVLLIVSLAAGLLLLRSAWARAIVVAAVVPIALLRNGFRIFLLGQLSADYGLHMLNSWLHTRGGQVFFALSLLPLFALVLALRRLQPATTVPASTRS